VSILRIEICILTEGARGFPQSLQSNFEIVLRIRARATEDAANNRITQE
jgi:hypothetical protein